MDELKKLIQAMVISSAGRSMTVAQLNKDFKYHEGYNIPYQQFGFKKLDAMLLGMSDAVQLQGHGPTALVSPITSEKNAHIRQMIVKQKTNFKRGSTQPRYPTHSGSRNRHPSPRYHFAPADYARRNDFAINSSCDESLSSAEELYCGQNYDFYRQTSRNEPTRQANPNNVQVTNSVRSNTMPIADKTKGIEAQPRITPPVAGCAEITPPCLPSIPVTAMTLTDRLSERQLRTDVVKPGCMYKTMAVSVCSPSEIYVHMMCHTKVLMRVADELELMFGESDADCDWRLQEKAAEEGLYCVAKYRNFWYRGMIAGPVVGHDRVTVFFIDYGCKRTVELGEIRYMREKDNLLPPQNFVVSLAHVRPSEGQWTEQATQYLREATASKLLHMYVVNVNEQDTVLDVIFIDTDTDADVVLNSELVLQKHAKWVHTI